MPIECSFFFDAGKPLRQVTSAWEYADLQPTKITMGFENGRAHVLVRHAQNTKYERQNMQHMRNIYMFLIWKSSFACKKHKNNAWYDRPKSHFHVETHGIIFAKSQWSNQEIAKSLEDDPAP